jgi:hypothetical protein
MSQTWRAPTFGEVTGLTGQAFTFLAADITIQLQAHSFHLTRQDTRAAHGFTAFAMVIQSIGLIRMDLRRNSRASLSIRELAPLLEIIRVIGSTYYFRHPPPATRWDRERKAH